MPSLRWEVSKMDKIAKVYAKAILNGSKSIDGVPGVMREAVEKWLEVLSDGKAGDGDE